MANMRGDNEVKRRGKGKGAKRGPKPINTASMFLADFTTGTSMKPSRILTVPEGYLRKQDKKNVNGIWTYPQKGHIKWKNY